MSEKLERVVAEAQLRPGLLVELRDCIAGPIHARCGRTHRVMLLSRGARVRNWGVLVVGWEVTPFGPCPSNRPVIGASTSIREGRLFIVNPFDESETSTPVKRVRERTRG